MRALFLPALRLFGPTMRDVSTHTAKREAIAGVSPRVARCLLIAALALAALGLSIGTGAGLRLSSKPAEGDVALYQAIQHHLAEGYGYYRSAAVEHRRRGYPLRPFVAVRPPALAGLITLIGGPGLALWVLRGLAVWTVCATARRFSGQPVSRGARIATVALLALTLAAFAQPALVWWHELWAGLLVLLAVMVRRPGQWARSLAVAVAAVLIREFALLLPIVMAGWALAERQRREAVAWITVLAAGLGALAVHAALLSMVVRPGDLSSPGWVAVGGWRFVLSAARSGSLLLLLPPWVAALAVPLALFGWASWPHPLGRRIVTLLACWIGAFLLIGRPDNGYWGLLIGPMLTMGLALVPQGWRRCRREQRTTPDRLVAM